MTPREQDTFPTTHNVNPSDSTANPYGPGGSSGAYYAYNLGREVQGYHQQLFSQYAYEVSRDSQMSMTYGRK